MFSGRYRPNGPVVEAKPDSLEWFLMERYCLYASDSRGLHRAEIHHPPWELRTAEAELSLNTMPPDGLELEGEPICHLAERQDVVIWPLESAQQAASADSKRDLPRQKARNQEE